MRFAFIWHKIFDARAGANLCAEIQKHGHTALCLPVEHRSREALSHFDVVMEVGARDEEIPPQCVHIAWVQEYFGFGDPHYENALGHDLTYTFGEPEVIGAPRFKQWAGSLVMGTDSALLDAPLPTNQNVDLSLTGFVAPLDWFVPKAVNPAKFSKDKFGVGPEATELIVRTTKIEPLAGSFSQVGEFERYRVGLRRMFCEKGWQTNAQGWDEYDEYGARTVHQFARMINRLALVAKMREVSDRIVLQGLNWDFIPELRRWARGHTNDEEGLYRLYRQSKINVHDNIFGFAMHSRVLDAMAVGGFVMANVSPHGNKAGQMRESFEPWEHFGEYDAESFVDVAKYWLANTEQRRRAAERARAVIRSKHLWEHRAAQVLGDLGERKAYQRAC